MKYSQKKVVDFYKETANKFNVYSFNVKTMRRESAYIGCNCMTAFQEMINKSAAGFLVLVINDKGEKEATKWEIQNHARVPYEFCKQFAVKTYIETNRVSRF